MLPKTRAKTTHAIRASTISIREHQWPQEVPTLPEIEQLSFSSRNSDEFLIVSKFQGGGISHGKHLKRKASKMHNTSKCKHDTCNWLINAA